MPRFLEGVSVNRFGEQLPRQRGGLCLRKPWRGQRRSSQQTTHNRARSSSTGRPGRRSKDVRRISGATSTSPPLRKSDLPERKWGPFQG
jgi:hypothetical protein